MNVKEIPKQNWPNKCLGLGPRNMSVLLKLNQSVSGVVWGFLMYVYLFALLSFLAAWV